MRNQIIDITGKVFGRLTALHVVTGASPVRWLCQCSCGRTKTIYGANLRRGTTRSCGCLTRERLQSRQTKHGHKAGGRYTPEYIAWSNIIARCTRPRSQAWANYGGRGITICDRWRHDFVAFLADVGSRPSSLHSIDRIDNDCGYEPGNVRWATSSDQAKNRRGRERDAEGRFR